MAVFSFEWGQIQGDKGQQHLSMMVAHNILESITVLFFYLEHALQKENAHSLVKPLQLNGRTCTYVNNLAVLCTRSIKGKVVLQ